MSDEREYVRAFPATMYVDRSRQVARGVGIPLGELLRIVKDLVEANAPWELEEMLTSTNDEVERLFELGGPEERRRLAVVAWRGQILELAVDESFRQWGLAGPWPGAGLLP